MKGIRTDESWTGVCGPGNDSTIVRVTRVRGSVGLTPQSLPMCSWSGDPRPRQAEAARAELAVNVTARTPNPERERESGRFIPMNPSDGAGGPRGSADLLAVWGRSCSYQPGGLWPCRYHWPFAVSPVPHPLVIALSPPCGAVRPGLGAQEREDTGGHKPSTHQRLGGAQAKMLTLPWMGAAHNVDH